MGTSKSIQDLAQELIEVPLFVWLDKTYFFTNERMLVGLNKITAELAGYGWLVNNTRISGWRNIRYLKKVFEEENSDIIYEALEKLHIGGNVDKLIMPILEKQKITWKTVKMRNLPWWRQLDLIGEVFLERSGKAYGFNYAGQYDCLGESDYKGEEPKINEELVCDIFNYATNYSGAFKIVAQVIKELKVGDSIKTFDDNIVKERKKKRAQYKKEHPNNSLDRFIAKIGSPSFERANDNQKKGTVDFIRVDVSIITRWHENRWAYIQKNKKEITRRVLEKIEQSKRFQAIGVPINFWKVTSLTLTCDSILEYVFELKIKE